MKKLINISILFLLLTRVLFSFVISDTLFDQRVDQVEGYKEIVLKNSSIENMRFKVMVLKVDEKDMSAWVELSPKVLNIPPKGEKVLKIFAKAPQNTAVGEYSFILQVEPIVIPTISKDEDGKVKANSIVAFVTNIRMFGYVGDANFKENINFEDIKLKKVSGKYMLTGVLSNKSFAGKNIGFNFIGSNNTKIDIKKIGRIKPNFKQEISIDLKSSIKEIGIYDADTYEEIKRVPVS